MEQRNERGQTLPEFLASYDENRYRHPSVTVDMAVFALTGAQNGHALSVLLIRRRNHPNIGKWALPGGFVEMDEDLSAAAARELAEETGASGLAFRQFGTFGAVERDPRTRVITVGHYAVAPYGKILPAAGDDAADAAWFRVDLKRGAFTGAAELFDLTLTGPETLFARVNRRADALGGYFTPVEGSALASDHALLIVSALDALNAQPRACIAGLLAGEKGSMLTIARRAADAVLSEL